MNIKTKFLIPLAIIAVILTVVFIISKKAGWFEETQTYEALTEVRGEDAGDVIALLPEGHEWSETEKTSYLILKIRLVPEDAAKLTQPETREAKPPLGSEASKDEKRDMEPRRETIRARAYRLKIETLEFNPDEIWKGQPYADKIFDKDLIEKK